MGSKCNKLLLLDISHHKKLQYRNIPMPPAPPRSFGLNVHGWGECGIHCIALNPCGDLIATGGSNPADCLILRTSDWSPVATLIVSFITPNRLSRPSVSGMRLLFFASHVDELLPCDVSRRAIEIGYSELPG